jgi:hypothetical protein
VTVVELVATSEFKTLRNHHAPSTVHSPKLYMYKASASIHKRACYTCHSPQLYASLLWKRNPVE